MAGAAHHLDGGVPSGDFLPIHVRNAGQRTVYLLVAAGAAGSDRVVSPHQFRVVARRARAVARFRRQLPRPSALHLVRCAHDRAACRDRARDLRVEGDAGAGHAGLAGRDRGLGEHRRIGHSNRHALHPLDPAGAGAGRRDGGAFAVLASASPWIPMWRLVGGGGGVGLHPAHPAEARLT